MNQLSNKTTPIVCALLAVLAILAAPGAFAQSPTDTWGGNSSVNLNDAGNWTTGNAPPVSGDSWLFGPAGTAGTVLDNSYVGGITVSNILFNGPGAFTFTDNAITLTHSISNASTALQTFNVPISISAPATVSLTAGGGDITIGGLVSGSSALNLAGAGNLTLTNVNTGFTGSITNNATLILSGAGAIGPGSAGAYTWGGNSFSNNGVLIYSSSATNTFNPRTDGNGSIIVNGPGEFISSPNNSWGVSGDITVNGGIYADQKGYPANGRSGFGNTANGPTGGQRTITVNSGGIISVDATTAFGQNNTVVHNLVFVANTNGLLRVTTGSSVFTNIVVNGGTVLASGGTFDLQASIITGGTLPSQIIANTGQGFTLGVSAATGYQTPFVVNPTAGGSGAGGADLIVSGALENSANNGTATGFALSGGGTMLLSGTNTFTGPIAVNQGTLILGQAGVLNSGSFPGNITVASGATFIVNTSPPQTNTGVMSGAGTLVIPAGTLYLAGTASTVSPLILAISNGATLDVTQLTNGTTLGSTIMGFGTVNGNLNTASGALIEGGIPGTPYALPINGNLSMAVGADFVLALSDSATGPNNGSVAVTGILTVNGTQVRLTATSGQNLDTQNYTLVTTTGGVVGSVSAGVIWDVAPANANHYYVTNINNNVVLAYSATPIPTPAGVTSPASILRNGTALLIVTVVPGNGTVTNVTVDASSLGVPSSLALAANGVLNTWTNSVYIGPGIPAKAYLLPATATDTTPITGHGIVTVNVVASTDTWAGSGADENFDTAANWAVESGQTAPYPPAYFGDSLTFAGTANLAPVMDNSYSINNLLFANGAGAFTITAASTNVLTLMGGVTNLSTSSQTLNLPVISGLAAPQIVSASNGNLAMSGGFADNNGGLMVLGPNAHTFNLAGNSTFTGPLTVRRGAMTLTGTLTNTNTLNVADLGGTAATLNVGSGGLLAVTDGINVLLGAGPNSTAAMSLGAGGSLTVPSGTLNLGNGLVSSAYFNMTGGNASIGSFVYVGQFGDHARFDMSGGTFTITSNIMRLGTELGQTNQFGEANFTGGTFNSLNQESSAGYGGGLFVGEYGTGVLNVSGTAVLNIWGDTNLVLGVNTTPFGISFEALGNGTVNLLGGAIVTAQVAGGTGISSTFNFNGGLLSNYNGSINWITGGPGPAFMYGLLNAYVYPGGAFIDDGGGNIIINQALQAPSGYGVASIAVNNGGSGYIAPPYVTITGGSGKGATASAAISAAGVVTAFNVTCPGSGYASSDALTVTLTGGGGTSASAKTPVLAANGSGGLTYNSQAGTGSGTLTLTAPATYTNATIVQTGALQVGLGGSINNSAVLCVSNGARFDFSGAGGLNLSGTQTLKGGGTVIGPIIASSGSMIYPGADPAIGTLTVYYGLNMKPGANASFNLTSLASGANDQVVLSGSQGSLIFANNNIHIKALGGTALDTTSPYVLFQNNLGVLGGLPSVTPVFDVAPANLNTGHWLIQPSGANIVLLNSSSSPPGGSGSITSGATLGTNIVRNTSIAINASVSGPNPVVNVYMDLSAFGGSVTSFTHGAGNTWTATVPVPAGMPPGLASLPILAYDGTLYGEISLVVNVLTTTDTWNGADFTTNPNSDDNANWVGGAAPGYVGDSVIFAGGTGLTPVFNQSYSFNGIGFASGAGLFVLGGGTVGVGGGVTNNSANVESVNVPLTLSGANTFFNGASGILVLSNSVSGSGQLNVAGTGGVTLDGTASYSGNTYIATNSTLIMGATGQWFDASGDMSYPGATTNYGSFIYNSPLTQTNAGVISGTGAIIVNGPGALSLSGANSYTGNLIINGGIVYDPVVENVGAPVVGGLGNAQSTNTITTINNGGTLILNAAGGNEFGYGTATPLLKFVVNTNGLLQITSGNATMGPVTLNGGTLSCASAASTQYECFELQSITVGGTVPSAISCGTGFGGSTSGINLTINGATGAQMPLNVASTGSSGPDLVVSAVMANAGGSQNAAGFVKTGAGTMEMTATNIFTGPITVSSGTAILGGAGQLNTGYYSNNIAIGSGGTFAFGSSAYQTNAGVISGAGTLLVSNTSGPGLILSNAVNTLTGPVVIKSGTLALIAGASLNSSSGVSIAGGAIFDVSLLPSPYVWPAASSVIASGTTANPATINSPGAVILTNSPVVLNYDNTNAAPQPALNITGNLTLGGNAFTVNSANGLPLANGAYVVAQASGTVTSTGNYPPVAGTAIGPTSKGAISVSGSQVLLTVSAIPTSPPNMSFSLSGKVLTFNWPADHQGWILQSNSINLAVPGDWFNVPGSSSVTTFPINVNTAQTNVYYRLFLP